jgi:hypothetical protein
MNKLIKELIEQAGAKELGADLYGGEFIGAIRSDFLEKFTKLIGSECLTLADSIRHGCDEDGEKQQALGAAWVGLAIARHFGVE